MLISEAGSLAGWMTSVVHCWPLAGSYVHMHICHTELQSNVEKPPLQMFLKEKGSFSLACIVRTILLEGTG